MSTTDLSSPTVALTEKTSQMVNVRFCNVPSNGTYQLKFKESFSISVSKGLVFY